MAAPGDEVLDGYVYPACAPYSYSYPYPPGAKGKAPAGGGGWRHRSRGYLPASSSSSSSSARVASAAFPGYGQLMAAEYFDNYQRAQLMALLSQVSPGFVPRPRRASSRDVGVQVNPRRDASVQCSLGRRTLLRRTRDPGPSASPQASHRGPEVGSPSSVAPRPVRFPRTVAVYSPVVSRRLTTFLEGAEAAAAGAGQPKAGALEGEQGLSSRFESSEQAGTSARKALLWPQSEKDDDEAQAAVQASWEQPADGAGAPAREDRGGDAAQSSPEQPRRAEDTTVAKDRSSPPPSPEARRERLRFQFLEQKYGYYHCKDCNIRWESAYVWCVQGTNKVYFKQFCRSCQKSYNPYRVEDITCQSCNQTRCSCPVKLRHVDPKRPHRQDLCGRCKGKRLSCDSTFSFKYII
ncbi:PREDICTED: zygote arrest protein 1 [Chrysochloris asiatica]|uniref:Zygote arrest protein 1 n=1 Tax=Chrysochloris asiatica TaxID=185453 RepID=A0A9B0WYL9_CHRAS|nr:PREDICTED: zygote arrest protein 1 [Chrysochloris asiatica]